MQNQVSAANFIDGNDLTAEQHTSKERNEGFYYKQVSFFQLFRFATSFDYILMIIGTVSSLAMGAAYPIFSFLWGNMTDNFTDSKSISVKAKETMLTYIFVGLGVFASGWLMFACWMITGQRQAIKCRQEYLKSLLKQQIEFFEIQNQNQMTSAFSSDCFKFQGAIGEKISSLLMTLSSFISGFAVAFAVGWVVTLVMLATIPALGISGYFYIKAILQQEKNRQSSYLKASSRAQEAISSIKTVKQYNAQKFQVQIYKGNLQQQSKKSIKPIVLAAIGRASISFVLIASYALGFWFGAQCIINSGSCPLEISNQEYTAGKILTIFFSVTLGGFNLTQLTPAFKKIAQGKQAASRIYSVIDRKPKVKNPPQPIMIENVEGIIKFENVTFGYPKDPQKKVLRNLTLQFNMKKSALIGESGSGKSTIFQLIMRFYDPDEGKITLDGHDLKDLDLNWLRKQISYVGQQSILFATTIKENLLIGDMTASQEKLVQVLKQAQALEFVQNFKDKMQTFVGYNGSQLSGGQKQRLALARALLKKPKIILLDQATSSLDKINQALIQKTLEKLNEQVKCITIAHRLEAIKNADMIFMLSQGKVIQKGNPKDISVFKNFQQNEPDEQATNEERGYNKIAKNQSTEQRKTDQEQRKKENQQKQNEKYLLEKYNKSIFCRVLSYSSGRVAYFVIGTILSLGVASIFPITSLFLSKILASMLLLNQSLNNISETQKVNFYSLMFFVMSLVALFGYSIQFICRDMVGQHVTKLLRIQTFSKIIKMPIKWFDRQRNTPGILISKLSTDCELANNLATSIFSLIIQNISTVLTGLIIAFVHQWRTTLVSLGLLPLILISGLIQMAFNTGFSDKTDEAYKQSSNLMVEALNNIRTIASYTNQSSIVDKYNKKLSQPKRLAIHKGNVSGLFFGLSQAMMFFVFGILFFIGGLFIEKNQDLSVEKVFTVIYSIIYAGIISGQNAHFIPDVTSSKIAAAKIFQILDQVDEDQMQASQNSKLLHQGIIGGDISFKNVTFKFESRKQFVYENISFQIKTGEKTAIVGPSGCGKSTLVQILQRFYDISSGSVTIGGQDIKNFDLHYLRNSFGLISQEPVLFDLSLLDNIKYNKEEASQTDLRNAAEKANILQFINEKKDDKGKVGIKGSHISGGQKQRIAIARTILRKPQILILDEATSALDKQNEVKVQTALDQLMDKKTVIIISHNLNTVKNSDKVLVFEKGRIVEEGKYEDLIKKKGYLYGLEKGEKINQFR